MDKKYNPNLNPNREPDPETLSTQEKQRNYYSQLNVGGDVHRKTRDHHSQRYSNVEPPVTHTVNSNGPRQNNTTNYKPMKRKKPKSKAVKVLITLICIVLAAIIAVTGTGVYYLNKINYDDGTLKAAPVNPDGDDGEGDILNGGLSGDEKNSLADANASINVNLNNNEIWYSDQVKNILLMGIDYGSSTFPYGRSDSMIVVSINEVSHKVRLISLGRALYAAIPGYENTRLSHAHGYGGAPLAITAIQNNYKIKIDNYASVNFASFSKIIDALGGVTITLTNAEAGAISHLLGTSQGGTYNLNGDQALAYARTRKIDSDKDRTGRQRKVLNSLADKAKGLPLTQLVSMMDEVLPLVTTDMSRTQLLGYLTKAMTYLNYEREQYVLPHKSSALQLRGGFEVVLVDWSDEIPYVHELFYGGVEAKTMTY